MTSELIYIQLPEPTPAQIMKVIEDAKKEEIRYMNNSGTTENFRLVFLEKKIIEPIEKLKYAMQNNS